MQIRSLGLEDILEEEIILAWKTPLFLFGKFHGQRNLASCSHRGHKEWALGESESCSVVSDSATPWTISPWESPGQNTGVFPSPGDLPNPGIEPRSPALQVDSLTVEL